MKKMLTAALAGVILLGSTAHAETETDKLKKEIQDQYNSILKLQTRLDQLEKQQTSQQKMLNDVKENSSSPFSLAKGDAVEFSGDFRYRYENIRDDSKSDSKARKRDRNRYRARLGMKVKVNPDTDFKMRVASGSADPVSTNETEGDAFASDDFWIDRAYIDWHPECLGPVKNVYFGKMANPFYRVGKNQLIWDGDLNPEGIAAKFGGKIDETTSYFASTGCFWVVENKADTDVSLWGLQGGLKKQLNKYSYITSGLSWYDYGNLQGQDALEDAWNDGGTKAYGNSTINDKYDYDYDILEAFGEYGTQVNGMPVAVYGNYVQNTAASDNNQGYLIGTKINKAKKPGSWEFGYNYRDLEADAVVGQFSDSDFIGGGTNGKGHKFGFNYQMSKNAQTGITYFLNEKGDSNDDYKRLQVDFKLKF